MGNFTANQVRNLKSPGRYSDGNGLLLDIGKSARGSWVVRVQSGGRRHDIGIGSLSALTLGEARDAAAQIRREVRAGIDVVARRIQEREVIPSFREAALKVHAEHKAA
jgi:Arm DNA-binding domain